MLLLWLNFVDRYIGPDSLALVHSNPAKMLDIATAATGPCKPAGLRCLDMCTGSGVQALALLLSGENALSSSRHLATLIDLNPRCVRFAIANAFFNNLEEQVCVRVGDAGNLTETEVVFTGAEYYRSNLMKSDEAVTLIDACIPADIVLINPPYIPSVCAGLGHLAKNVVQHEEECDVEGDDSDPASISDEDSPDTVGITSCLQAYGEGGICGESVTSRALNSQNLRGFVSRDGPLMTCVVANLMDPTNYPSKIRR
jgi:16S rRNA G966 N2-methylase RsmD